jgi:hypothetical protein
MKIIYLVLCNRGLLHGQFSKKYELLFIAQICIFLSLICRFLQISVSFRISKSICTVPFLFRTVPLCSAFSGTEQRNKKIVIAFLLDVNSHYLYRRT